MNHDIRTLFWLQARLLRNAFKRQNAQDTGRLVGVILLAAITLPGALAAAVGAAVGLRLFDDPLLEAGGIALFFTFLLLIWLATPASNQQFVEPLRLSRLVVHPLSFRNLVLGSFLVNSASLAALLTLPLLLAVVVGAPRSLWQVLPIALAAFLLLLVFLVVKSLIDDLMDLVAEDRRLRLLIIMVSLLPFLLFYFGQFAFSFGSFNDGGEPNITMDMVRRAAAWLRWLPPAGWFAEAVYGAMTGAWARWLWGVAGLALLGGGGLALHVRLMRRLFYGDFLRSGVQRMKSSALAPPRALPFLPATASADLQALWRKDWLNFRRSPMTARMVFLPILIVVMTFFLGGIPEMPSLALAAGIGGFAAFMTAMLSHNQLATYDHLGLGTLLLSPAPRRLILLSQGLLNLGVVTTIALLGGIVGGLRSGDPVVPLIAVGVGLLFQLPFNGLSHLTSLIFPYKVDLERGSAAANEARQSFFTVISIFIGIPILSAPLALILGGFWFLAPSWLALGILLALIYSLGAYLLLLHLATRLFPRREETLIERIVSSR